MSLQGNESVFTSPASPGGSAMGSGETVSSGALGSGEASGPSSDGFLQTLRAHVYRRGQKDMQLTYPNSKRNIHTDCNSLMKSWVGQEGQAD